MVFMPASLGRVHKLVSSSRVEKIVSLLHSKQYLPPWLETVRHFSFIDDRSGRNKQPDGEFDDFLLPQSDSSFKDNGGNRTQEPYNVEWSMSDSIPSRPLRGRKPSNQPPKFRENNRRSHSFSPRFDDNHGVTDEMAERNRDVGQSGDNFLDKFKFDFDNKRVNLSEVSASKQSEEAKRSNPNQPAQETMPQDVDEIFKKMK